MCETHIFLFVYGLSNEFDDRVSIFFNEKYIKGAASDIDDEERRVRESDGKDVDNLMKNSIEGIIIKWAHQARSFHCSL